VKIRFFTARWAEICRDFERAPNSTQSLLFKQVYEGEFGSPGGEPFGMLVADYEVRPRARPGSPTDDNRGLDGLAGVAAAAFAPAAIAAHPALLGIDTWSDLGAAADLTDVLRGADRTRWRSLQGREDSRFLSVVLPRVLGRAPWADDATRADGFRYREYAPGPEGARLDQPGLRARGRGDSRLCQGRLAGRCARCRDRARGIGRRDRHIARRTPVGRPARGHAAPAGRGRADRRPGTPGGRGRLHPLHRLELLPEASFAATPSIHRPPRMQGETAAVANANQRLSAQFNAMLCVSRFAHCVKLMGRDMVGSFQTADDIQFRLQRWLQGFTNISAGGAGDGGARFPLREARVEVFEKPGQPGVFGCTVMLQPHYQLD
jgi:predicted component of type VI protein secretion system